MHTPATASTANINALRCSKSSRDYATAMAASCRLMATHRPEQSFWLAEQAIAWEHYADPSMKDVAPGWPGPPPEPPEIA